MTNSIIKQVIVLGSGTSTGVPSIGCECSVCTSPNIKNQRTRSSIVIQTEKENILVDCGPDFRTQMLSAKISHLDAVFFTHTHADHCHGFDDLRQLGFRRKDPIPCYIDAPHAQDLRNRFFYAFEKTDYQGAVPNVELRLLEEKESVFGMNIDIFRLKHVGNNRTLGFKFDQFLYFTDFKGVEEDVLRKLRGQLDTVIMSAARKQHHASHSNLSETLEIIAELKPRRALLTHLSHDYDHEIDNLTLPQGVELAYDGCKLAFS